jgi:hypothetical protein
VYLEVYAWFFIGKLQHIVHCRTYIKLLKKRKKDSIESKVDMKLPFAMLNLMTPYMVQIIFFQISIELFKMNVKISHNFVHELYAPSLMHNNLEISARAAFHLGINLRS